MSVTFFLIVVGMIIFRAESIIQAVDFLTSMFSNHFYDATQLLGKNWLFSGLALLAVEWFQRDKQHALQFSNIKPFNYRWVRWGIYYLILSIIFKYSGENQTFIYFQF